MTGFKKLSELEAQGTGITRFNALKHGVLSAHTVLPWEDAGEYEALVAALVAEHAPSGPTEEHLVEELAGVFWRKRRLRLAEAAVHRSALRDACDTRFSTVARAALFHLDHVADGERVVDAIRATPDDTADEMRGLDEVEAAIEKAVSILKLGGEGAYRRALALLRADIRDWWSTFLTDQPESPDRRAEHYTSNTADLRRFIDFELRPRCEVVREQLKNRGALREHAFGESLDPKALSQLARYEVHLDRKLERMLVILLRLKDLRREPNTN